MNSVLSSQLPVLSHLLFHRVLKVEGVRHYLIAGFEAGDYFLLLVGQHAPGRDFGPLEVSAAERHVDPLAVVKVQNRGSGNGGVSLRLFAEECGAGKHADPHHSRILHLQTYFCGTDAGIENRQNVIDASLEGLVRIRIEMDLGSLADADRVEIVFINVADDPDVGKIGNRKRIRTRQRLNAGGVGDLLVRDDAGDRRLDVDDAGWMLFINAKKSQLFGGGVQIGLGVGFGSIGGFEGALGDGSFVEEKLGSFLLYASQALVVLGLDVDLVSAGDVIALDLQQ